MARRLWTRPRGWDWTYRWRQWLLVGGARLRRRAPALERLKVGEGDGVVVAGSKEEKLVGLEGGGGHVGRGDDGLHADVEGGADRLADGQREIEGAREGMRGVVGDAGRQADRDDVRYARLDEGLRGGLCGEKHNTR